jgi:Protein of unknown function (DUF2505)
MDFTVSASIDASFVQVVEALQDPAYYQQLGTLGGASVRPPELLSASHEGSVVGLEVRYAFAGEISGPVAMAVDVEKLTWVIHTRLNVNDGTASLDVVPDHYADLLTCEATASFREDGHRTIESLSGELVVKVPLFGSTIEGAIVQGLEAHVDMEARALSAFCS